MADRPIFIPSKSAPGATVDVMLNIPWASGFAPTQKKKNIVALHNAAARAGYHPLLEVSTKSDDKLGRHLSAFHLKVKSSEFGEIPLECAYQGSKVFEDGGPFTDLYRVDARTAKRDPRLQHSGKLLGFLFEGSRFGLEPKTAFYDWLYIKSIFPHREWLKRLHEYAGFTDIEFNPHKSINCQARSCALFVSLTRSNLLDEEALAPERFIELVSEHAHSRTDAPETKTRHQSRRSEVSSRPVLSNAEPRHKHFPTAQLGLPLQKEGLAPTSQERFLYHSFPRRDRDKPEELTTGYKILTLIRDWGLILAPEVVKWQYSHADGSAPRKQEVLQKRVCFTELAPDELPKHADKFGHFALEFRIDTLKSLGAIPVFYIPQASKEGGEPIELGSTVVVQLIDAMVLAMRLAGIKQALESSDEQASEIACTFGFDKPETFHLNRAELRKAVNAFSYALTPPEMLEQGLAGLLNMFYPADDISHDDALRYYRQREWRVVRNFAVRGQEVMKLPSPELSERLLRVDSGFWTGEFPKGSGSGRTVLDEIVVYPGIDGRSFLRLVNRIIVPAEALENTREILRDVIPAQDIVSLEGLITQ
jgi:hypothetical protein